MFIINVIPLKRIPRGISQNLSYFSSEKIEPGVLVIVKIRTKETLAITVLCEDAKNKKIEIKKGNFKLQPIDKILLNEPVLTKEQIEIAFWISSYYIEPLSLIFKTITPIIPIKIVNALYSKNTPKNELSLKKITYKGLKQPKIKLLKSRTIAESLFFLKDEIKKILKSKKQILILVPENTSIKIVSQILKNILPKSEILEVAKKSAKNKFWSCYSSVKNGKAKIIIGTRSSTLLPFYNLGLIIATSEHNDSYKQWKGHPLYDARDIVKKLSKIFKAKIIFESSSPTVSSFWRAKNKIYGFIDSSPKKEKSLIEIINMKDEQKKDNYSIFSEYFIDKLKKIIKNKQRAVLFLNRRGAANFIICKTCGNIAKCPICKIPLVYYRNNVSIDPEKRNKLICNHCGFIADLPNKCSKCQGTEIKYLGLGTQKAEIQSKKIFPNINILRLDSDSAKNQKDIKKILNLFNKKLPSILISTQQFLSIANTPKISFIGIISLDAMLAIPNFKTDEKVFNTVWQLNNLCKDIAIQTYSKDNPLLKSFTTLNYEDFAEKEIANRKILFYPPFSKIIKLKLKSLNIEQSKNELEIISNQIKNTFKDKISDDTIKISKPVRAFIFREKGFYNWHIIIKIKNEENQNSLNNDKLMLSVGNILSKIIPQNWDIDVNPENLI